MAIQWGWDLTSTIYPASVKTVAIPPGDGIGPEVIAQARRVPQ